MSSQYARTLIGGYDTILRREGMPEWSAEFEPTIPFVGTQWSPGRSVLVYGSAENWAGADWSPGDYPVLRLNPRDRHRTDFEIWRSNSSRPAFPSLHLQPATDGTLQVAAAFIRQIDGMSVPVDVADAAEHSAFGNFAKFAIDSKRTNQDYASDVLKLLPSLPYVEADLGVLRPRRVLIPKTMIDALRFPPRRIRELVVPWAGLIRQLECVAIPVKQANQRALNHLARKPAICRRAEQLRTEYGTATWSSWIPNVRRVNADSVWRYLAEIELAMADSLGAEPRTVPGN